MIRYVSDAPDAPQAIGPYSQATVCGNIVRLAGQIPLNPTTGELVGPGIEEQTHQVMKNIIGVLKHLSLDFSHVTMSTIYLTNMEHFKTVNAIYEQHLSGAKPARATVTVAGLPRDSKIEIVMEAVTGK